MDIFNGKSIYQNFQELGQYRKYDIVCDMDEVLVNISPAWVSHAILNDKIARFLGTEKLEFMAKYDITSLVLARNEYYLSKWLELDEEHDILFQSLYHDKGDVFYDGLYPTSFAIGLMDIIESPAINKIWIMSHVTLNDNSSKELFVERYLRHKKFELVKVPLGNKKSGVINEMGIDYISFIDDSMNNIIDVVTNTRSETKEFTLPKLGYNILTPEIEALIENKFLRFGYYENVI
jgi:hypothetical protein